MLRREKLLGLPIVAVLVLCLAVMLGAVMAQNSISGSNDQTPDQLGPLKQALSDAAASALTTAQETSILVLITDFQTATKPAASATRLAYDNDILLGNATAAAKLIQALIDERTAEEVARMNAQVTFAVGVVKVLQSDQMNLLQTKLGVDALVQLIQSLAAGGPAMGGPVGDPGGGTTGQAPPPRKK